MQADNPPACTCPKQKGLIRLLMIEWTSFFAGAAQLLNWQAILLMIAGIFFGILCGAIPGFSASMAVVVVLPLTFSMEPLVAMVFLCSIYVAAVYGGSITAILINTPGTANSAATSFDGYPMTVQGRAGEALGLSIGASCIGGVISYGFMLILMYPIAAFAVKFGSAEMFLLAVFGLTIIGGISEGGLPKALMAGLFGVIVSTVGISPAGSIRGHFGSPWLLDGLPTVPTIIGFFALSEMFSMLNKDFVVEGTNAKRSIKEIVKGTLEPLKSPVNLFRSSLIGTFIGAVPAAGGTIASFISYNQAKQTSKNPDSFGKGNPEGVIASESSNNASTGGALITMFALGIPGSSTTAIMMSALMIQGLQPGPQLFMNQMPLVYAIIIALFLSQIVMWVAGIMFSYSLSGVLNVSTKILVPVISVLCMMGAFAIRKSMFDCVLVLIFGIIGYLMKKNGYPTIATVLGIILGPIADTNLIRTTIRFQGDYTVFLTRPICIGLLILTVVGVLVPIMVRKHRKPESS